MSQPDPDSTIVLITTRTETEAQIIVARLDEAGIQAEHAGEFSSGLGIEAFSGVRVLVHAKDAARARQVLEEMDNDQRSDDAGGAASS